MTWDKISSDSILHRSTKCWISNNGDRSRALKNWVSAADSGSDSDEAMMLKRPGRLGINLLHERQGREESSISKLTHYFYITCEFQYGCITQLINPVLQADI